MVGSIDTARPKGVPAGCFVKPFSQREASALLEQLGITDFRCLVEVEPGLWSVSVVVTPEIAAAWLKKRNKRNRPIVQRRIQSYSRDMQNETWGLVPDPICFDRDGTMRNGQHRLQALIRTEQTHRFLLLLNVNEQMFERMDQGKERRPADTIREYPDAIIRAVIGSHTRCERRLTATTAEAQLVLADCADGADWLIKQLEGYPHINRITIVPVLAAIHAAYWYVSTPRLAQFCQVLFSGETTAKVRDGAAITLRNWLLSHGGGPSAVYAVTQVAIEAFIDGQNLTRIPSRIDELPYQFAPDEMAALSTAG